uniref:Nucleotide-diphospho-sugar transferase domain-containing protein n=1 Tax=Haptolina ericina TaxID=156174 RepID=A0A7S3AHR0_9EUKA|mmetsp:Transcript_19477/g.43530  ORF Transcript_19477/g.43530 Transcript_19477/m.43530 type:complete len:221 (+) Transcript_19477:380-1042(+)
MMFGTHNNRASQIACLSQRLHELGSEYTLHVLTDQPTIFDDSRIRMVHTPDIEYGRRVIPSAHGRRLLLSSERHRTLNKLLLWNMTQFDRIVYMDPDIYLQNVPDELMHMILSRSLAAVHGCSGYFNSGFMVLSPDARTFERLMSLIGRRYETACDRSPDRDQTILNGVFRDDWQPLHSVWNMGTHYGENKNYTVLLRSGANIHFMAESKPHNLCNVSSW